MDKSRITVDKIGLPVRASNALMKNGVETLEDLFRTSYEEMSNFRGMGKTSLEAIKSFMGSDYEGAIHANNKKYSVGEFIIENAKKERNPEMLIQYYNSPSSTYEAISYKYGITRERVRQIIAKQIKALRAAGISGKIKDDIFGEIGRAADRRTEINLVNVGDEYMNNACVVRLLATAFSDEIKIVKSGILFGEWLAKKDDDVEKMIFMLYDNLRYRPAPMTVEEVKSLYSISDDMIMSINGIIEKDGYITVVKNKVATGSNRGTIIIDFMEKMGRPVSVNEIEANTSLKATQIRGALCDKHNFVNVGRSVYDLADADYSDLSIDDLAKNIIVAEDRALKIDAVAKYIRRYNNYSSWSEIIRAIASSSSFRVIDKYILLAEWDSSKIESLGYKENSYKIPLRKASLEIINSNDDIYDADKVRLLLEQKYGDTVSTAINSIQATLNTLANSGQIKKVGTKTGCYQRLGDNERETVKAEHDNETTLAKHDALSMFLEDKIGKRIEIRYRTNRMKSDKYWRMITVRDYDDSYIYAEELVMDKYHIRYSKEKVVDYRAAND